MEIKEPGSENNRVLVDTVSRESGKGAIRSSTHNLFRGFNHSRPGVASAPANLESGGFTFFGKPVLNLSYNNVRANNKLEFLADQRKDSIGCAIKCMLSPFGLKGIPSDTSPTNVRSSLVDDHQAFIPLISSSLLSMSGWPDPALDTYTTEEGYAKEVQNMADGRIDIRGSFDLQLTLRNSDGDPITTFIDAYLNYISGVITGELMPYPDFIVNKTIDYNMRIWRLVTDPSRTRLLKIASTCTAFPIGNSSGAAFNFNMEDLFGSENNQISLPLRCSGAEYNQGAVLIDEFNRSVEMFNQNMKEGVRQERMVQLTGDDLLKYNYYGYPYIENDARYYGRITWWLPKELINQE